VSPRLFLRVLSLEARTQMSYRGNFWLNVFAGFIAEFGVTYFVWKAVFHESGREIVAGYTFEALVLYYLAVVLLGKLVRGREFEAAVSTDIYEGGLNRYLVLPASYAAFKYAQRLGQLVPGFVQVGLFGVATVALLDLAPGPGITPASVAMTIVAVGVANLLYYLLDNVVHFVAFWADNVWSLDVAKWFVASLLGGFMVPLRMFPDGMRRVLEFLPFRFLFDFPARVLFGEIGPYEWAAGICLGLFWCLVAWLGGRLIWYRGRLRYTGVGI